MTQQRAFVKCRVIACRVIGAAKPLSGAACKNVSVATSIWGDDDLLTAFERDFLDLNAACSRNRSLVLGTNASCKIWGLFQRREIAEHKFIPAYHRSGSGSCNRLCRGMSD